MADATGKIVIEAKDNASKALDDIKGRSEKLSDSFKTAGKAMIGFGLAGAGLIASFAGAAGKIESMKVALRTTFEGSQKAADDAFNVISNFSTETPFQLDEVMGSFLKLKNLGLDPSIEALTSYGDTASSMGKSLNDMVEAVADASTGEFERLKEFGIRAKNLGDTVDFTFKGITTSVKNNSADIEKYLLGIGNMEGVKGGMEAQSRTLLGIWSSFKDSMFLLSASLGEPFKKPLSEMMDWIMKIANKLKDWVKANPEIAEMAAKFILVASAMALIAGPALLLIGFLPSIADGWKLVNLAMSGTLMPIALIIAGLSLLYWAWNSNFLGIRDIVKSALDWLKDKFQFFKDEISEIGRILSETWQKISDDWTAFMEIYGEQVQGGVDFIVGIFSLAWATIKLEFSLLWDAIKAIFAIAWELVSGVIKTALLLLKGDWSGAWEEIKDTFSDVWEIIRNFAKEVLDDIMGFINDVIGAIGKAIDGLKSLIGLSGKSTAMGGAEAGVLGKTLALVTHKQKASGGSVLGGTPYLVGERGPEMFVPSQGGNIVPNGRTSSGVTINIYGNVSSKEIAEEYGNVLIQKLKLHSAVV